MRILIIIKIIALTHNRRVFELAFLWNRASIATTKVANVISGEKTYRNSKVTLSRFRVKIADIVEIKLIVANISEIAAKNIALLAFSSLIPIFNLT